MILLLDDDQTSLFLLSTILRHDGYAPIEFDDAEAALAHIRTQGGVSLIISDLRMPRMDGLEFISAVREIPAARFTPILCCSSSHDAETVQVAIARGIRDFIVKPIDPIIVKRKVRSILRETGQTVSSREAVTSRLGITGAEYRELVRRTVSSLELLISELEMAVKAGDATAIGALAERIEEPASVFAAMGCLAVIVEVLSAPDRQRRVKIGQHLVREALLFRVAIEQSVAQVPVRSQASWVPART